MKRFYRQRKKTVTKPSKSRKKPKVIPYVGPEYSDEEMILRQFDMNSKYGPCLAMTRLERYERAVKWGLNPPQQIETILKNVDNLKWSECLWYSKLRPF